jgi:hypothetical protein
MEFDKDHPDYAAIHHHIRHAGMERSVALGESIADLLVKVAGGIKRYARKAHADRERMAESLRQSGALGIVTGQFERLGNSHREVLSSIRASARRDTFTATGSFIRRADIQR